MNNGLEPKEELQTEEFRAGKGKNKKFLILGSLMLIVVVLAVLATVFWDQILTSAISPFRVKVTPAKVIQGQTIVVTWPTFNKDKFPLERISFCTVANKPVCKIMLKSTVNDGQQKVITNYDAGTYRVLLQALDANGNFVSGVKITSNSFRIENKPGESNNGGGGSNNGGNDNNNDNNDDSDDSDNDGGDPFTPTINTPTPSASPVPVAVSDYKGTYTVAVANQSGRVTDGGPVKISDVNVSSGGVSWVTTGVKKDTTLTSVDGKTVDNTNCPVTTSIANVDNKFVYVCDPNSLSGTTFAKPGKHTFTVTATSRAGNRTAYKGAYEINTSVQGSQTTNNGTGIGFVTVSLATSSTQVNPVINWNLQDAVGVTSTSLTLDGTSMGTVSNFNANNNDNIRGPYKVTPARSKFDGNFIGIVNTAGLSIGSHAFTISAVHAGTEVSSEASVYSGSYTVGVASLAGKQTTNAGIKISDLKVSADGVSCVTTGVKKSLVLTIDDKAVTGTTSCPVSTPDSSVANKYTNFCSYSSLGGSNFSKIGSHNFVITAIGATGKKSYYKGTYKVVVSAEKGAQINNNGTAIGSVDVSLATTASQKTPVIKWNLQDAVGVKKVSYSLDGNVMGSISASENKPDKNISGPNAVRQARLKFDANFTGLVVDSGMTIGSHTFTISAEHSDTVVRLPTPAPTR
jgi:hypothetical protein